MNNKTITRWDTLPVVLDLHTVATILQVNEGTVKQWLYHGTIVGTKIGKQWFFDRDYIISLIRKEAC